MDIIEVAFDLKESVFILMNQRAEAIRIAEKTSNIDFTVSKVNKLFDNITDELYYIIQELCLDIEVNFGEFKEENIEYQNFLIKKAIDSTLSFYEQIEKHCTDYTDGITIQREKDIFANKFNYHINLINYTLLKIFESNTVIKGYDNTFKGGI